METSTRPLTLEEMYFSKRKRQHLPADTNQGLSNNNLLGSGAQIPPPPIPEIPAMDLSDDVFPKKNGTEKAGMFIKKNWAWLLLGTGILAVCIIVYNKKRKEKKENQLPKYPTTAFDTIHTA